MNPRTAGAIVLVALAGGIFVGTQLDDAGVANAAPRNAVITRDGSSAKVTSLTLTVLELSDGGTGYAVHPAGAFSESETLADAGVLVKEKASSAAPCALSGALATRAAAVVADALVCFRQGKQLER